MARARDALRAAANFLEVSKPLVRHTGKQKAEWLKPGLIARVRFLRGEEKLRHAKLVSVRVARQGPLVLASSYCRISPPLRGPLRAFLREARRLGVYRRAE
jgi:hypothetical protein